MTPNLPTLKRRKISSLEHLFYDSPPPNKKNIWTLVSGELNLVSEDLVE